MTNITPQGLHCMQMVSHLHGGYVHSEVKEDSEARKHRILPSYDLTVL